MRASVMEASVSSSLLTRRRDPGFYRAMLVGLAVGCPLDNRSDGCQLKCTRRGSIDDKIAWVESLDESEILALYTLHHDCFSASLAKA